MLDSKTCLSNLSLTLIHDSGWGKDRTIPKLTKLEMFLCNLPLPTHALRSWLCQPFVWALSLSKDILTMEQVDVIITNYEMKGSVFQLAGFLRDWEADFA